MSPFRLAVRTLFTAMPIKGARTMNEDRETLFARGEEYLSGDGPQDLTSALDCFRRSAELGYAPAQYELGLAHDPIALASAYGIPPNDAAAFRWYLKAAEQGYRKAMSTVAKAYQAGIRGAPQNRDEAAKWYGKLASLDDPDAMLQLGLMAIDENRRATAAQLLEKSAEFGEPIALAVYREYVADGVFPPLDPRKELALLQSAADKGDAESMLALGLKCEKGEGVPVDVEKAYALLALVSISEKADKGPGKATEGAERIKRRLSADQLKAAEALQAAMYERLSDTLD
jgi:uncharacterized protein